MTTKIPNVSLIILTRNALSMTKTQIGDVAKISTKGLRAECIVVDNGSVDDTEMVLKKYRLPNMSYKFIETGKNLGFAGGNNVGIKEALKIGSDYIVIMNNDLILSKDLLVKLISFMKKNPRVGLASPKMYFAKGYEFHKNKYKDSEKGKVIWYAGGIIDRNNVYTSHRGVDEVDHGQYDVISDTDVASGACMVGRREVFETIGMLDESLFLYWEDADLCERARRAGYRIAYYPNTYVWHKVSSSSDGSGGTTNDYFLTRNRFYFSMCYSPLWTKFAVIRDTLKLIFIGREWQKKGAIDALVGRKGMRQWQNN